MQSQFVTQYGARMDFRGLSPHHSSVTGHLCRSVTLLVILQTSDWSKQHTFGPLIGQSVDLYLTTG